jgi:hypothetical protein
MTNSPDDLLAALRTRLHNLERDQCILKAKREELEDVVGQLERSLHRGPGRPPGPRAVFTPRRGRLRGISETDTADDPPEEPETAP